MEKISGILPASPRIKAVDLKNSQPVRKGVPAFGRKVVRNDSGDRVTLTTLEKQELAKRMDTYKPRQPIQDIHNSDVPVKLANDFFVGPEIKSTEELPSVEEVMADVDRKVKLNDPGEPSDKTGDFTMGNYGKSATPLKYDDPAESLDLYV